MELLNYYIIRFLDITNKNIVKIIIKFMFCHKFLFKLNYYLIILNFLQYFPYSFIFIFFHI